MKQVTMLLALLFVALLPFTYQAQKTKEGGGKPASTSQEGVTDRESKTVRDMDGKALRPDEHYIAELTAKDGKVTAYRKNRKEVASLVKDLKDGGVTDRRLITRKLGCYANCV
ncbi:MAG: hypothetical protein IPO77_00635 [Acidobacteria bacterium]|nr:hypothetical protein [Acidobacteriota bacterium]